jgi:D-xylose 1-dehydrogenase (NADP+, D-xylono-1,5-lactone-forming)
MSRVRWGLLGTARINRRLIPAMRASSRSAIVAVASRDLARAEAHAVEWDIPNAVGSYDALLRRDDVDAVYVPVPNALHLQWTLEAVAAGKHVLCEKPLATAASDVDLIAAAAARAGVVVEEGFMYRHEPLTAVVVELVRNGAVGAVRTIASGFTYTQGRANDVRLVPSLGGGALWDVGCYPVSYACLLAGRDYVTAAAVARLAAGGVDEELTGVLRFPADVTAGIYAGFRAAHHTWLTVVGSEGSLLVPNPFKPGPAESLWLERCGERRSIDVAGSELLFARQIEHFVAAVLDGAPTTVPLADSRRTAAACRALLDAAGVGT